MQEGLWIQEITLYNGYDKVSNEIIWGIVIKHLPKLKQEVEDLLKG